MLRDIVDPLVKSAQPAIITGRKWNAKYAMETAESSLKRKEVIGQKGNRTKETTKNKRRMVSEDSSF